MYYFTDFSCLVLGMTSICLDNCLYAPGHTFYKTLAYFWWNSIPLINQSIPQFMCSLLEKLSFEIVPEVFNGIEVWRLCWPYQNFNIIVFKPLFGLPRGVLGVVVLFKAFHHPL